MSDSIIEQALDRFKVGSEAARAQRDRETEALKFQVPSEQWPKEARDQRNGGTIGGVPLPARPMLSIPKLDQPIQLELNKAKSAHLGVQIHPLSEDADDDTAEMLQDHYRQIEVDSRAELARGWAFERGIKSGWGVYRLLTEYDPAAPKGSKDQRILLRRILHQESVVLDPFSQEPNFSDARWGFITEWIPWSRYQQRYGTKDDADTSLASFEASELAALALECPMWVKGDGESRAVLVAEYFTVDEDRDGSITVTWRKMNAIETLEERALPGKALPIFVYVGRELIPFDTDRRFVGIIEPNMDAQRFFNYSASTAAETMGQEPKSTWIMAEGQEEGHEQEFLLANVRNFPYLRYKPTTVGTELAPPPQRVQADTSKLGLSIQALGMASEFVHAGTFAFEPSLGQNSPNVKTKGATLALQAQSDQSNSNWLQSLADTMTHEASVVLDWIAYYYDRPGRIIRTRDMENKHDRVMVNQPFVKRGGQLIPVNPQQLPQGVNADDVQHYDLQNGARYAVSVSIGKGYKSRVEQGQEALAPLMQADPGMALVVAPTYLRFRDEPGMKQAADDMKKFRDHQMPFLKDEDQQGDPKMQLEQAKAALQQMQQQLQEMGKAIETDKIKVEGQYRTAIDKAKIDAASATALQAMRDATSIAVAQINASVKIGQQATEAHNEALATGVEQAHDANQAAMDREHEMNTIVMQHRQALEQAQQNHTHALEQGEAGTANDAALADQAAGHASQAAEQQAALAPQPEAGV
jgi:hypothetical protein